MSACFAYVEPVICVCAAFADGGIDRAILDRVDCQVQRYCAVAAVYGSQLLCICACCTFIEPVFRVGAA